MNIALSRILKSVYRKEPLSSFIITVGAVDAVIGGLDDQWALFSLGILVVAIAIVIRVWQSQRHQVQEHQQAPEYYLPSHSSRPPLPMLSPAKKHPPHY